MRKVILNLAVTLDGYIEGPNGEIDWCVMEEDMQFDDFLDNVDTLFYGRVSYAAWGNYQPSDDASPSEKSLRMNVHSKTKYVFSSQKRREHNVTYIADDIAAEVMKIKKMEGKDIWLYGGASLIRTFISHGLIDKYIIALHPVVLGSGKSLFEALKDRLELKLSDTRVFKSGVIELSYIPA